MKRLIATSVLLAMISGCGNSKPNVEIETSDKVNPIFGIKYVQVKVKAIEDEVVVEDIVVNRGNCKIENKNALTG
jgi:hypothetical protein